jgi:hypothetical protein
MLKNLARKMKENMFANFNLKIIQDKKKISHFKKSVIMNYHGTMLKIDVILDMSFKEISDHELIPQYQTYPILHLFLTWYNGNS